MFATRNDIENAIYEQQTAAAAKPLNQGVKGLAPRTPGKTPFKGKGSDENAFFVPAKTGGKVKAGKGDLSAFITPAGPRTRAPLGAKTTNAKAAHLLSPANAAPSTTKPTSPRLRRAKVKIHTATSNPLNADEDDGPEIEYMPPREVPLPDHPDDVWPHDRKYPQFEGDNLMKGWAGAFGLTGKAYESDVDMSDYEAKLVKAETARRKREAAEKQPETVKAKGAAAALSGAGNKKGVPSFAAPTKATKARMPGLAVAGKKEKSAGAMAGNRHTVARAVSNTTLGYSKGRAVSASARSPLPGMHKRKGSDAGSTPFTFQQMLDELLDPKGMSTSTFEVEEEGEEAFEINSSKQVEIEVDVGLADFQLDMPQM